MRRTLSRVSLALSLAAALGAAACTRAGRAGRQAQPAAEPPVVTFRNESLYMTTVYAIRPSGDAWRVGTVAPGRTEQLRLTPSLTNAGPINFVAVPQASRRVASTGPVSLGPGERLAITLPVNQNILTVLPAPPQSPPQ